ncbi:hypothetical protein [Halomicrococcus gelatinilyticus]|uniref:hypothetical protein n=1 Tax=Halomicrococcus gelatinilyticus TaxID=1702103 RepID=UPI002E0E7429
MASPVYLASAALFGIALVALAATLARSRDWRVYAPPSEERDGFDAAEATMQSPTTWLWAFLLLALGVGGGAVLYVAGPAGVVRRSAWLAMGIVTAVMFGGFAFWGTYESVRHRGVGSATAALAGLWLVGGLFVVAVVVKLLTA